MIKEESTLELRFTIRHMLNEVHNSLIYPVPNEQQQNKKPQNNQQQQIVNQVALQSTSTAGHHHHHTPKLYQTQMIQVIDTV